MNVERIIREYIRYHGAISVDQFMEFALFHPEYGYYITQNPIGTNGDFTTAPEVSQFFGELMGVWLGFYWQEIGSPVEVKLIEVGPGQGTLMSDLLRATRNIKGFHDAIEIYMVETSPSLTAVQKQKLSDASVPIKWVKDVSKIPDGPSLIIANELFDALPIKQFVQTPEGFKERLISCGATGFNYVHSDEPIKDELLKDILSRRPYRDFENDSIVELSSSSIDIMTKLSKRLRYEKGAGLIIDYGYDINNVAPKPKATLQSVKEHQYSDVFDNIGESDLTAHVNFSLLAAVASELKIGATPALSQGTFLKAMGIELRGQMVSDNNKLDTDQKRDILKGIHRLTDPSEMGKLFKVMSIYSPQLPMPTVFREYFNDC
ncbi:MAG: SAM-dependent methyltransferase [Rickettsiales bacterium]|nr:SAM-dependent methyltransferase [Rickettsiales bacterium]